MSQSSPAGYRTSPELRTTMPPGIPYIVGNEAAERFSYYGMRTILMPFMMKFLLDRSGNLDTMNENDASARAHTFYTAVYFFPLLGAVLADRFFGKYSTIIWLSLVYCLGHFALSLDDTRNGLLVGLALIAFGAGGIKPCVSAHVGDQFGEQNKHLLPRVYSWFYFAINFGAFYSTLITPAILNRQGHFADWIPEGRSAQYAFALPGILMLLATIVFWSGRRKFAHIPPGGPGFLRQAFTKDGLSAIARLGILYVFVAFFWCLYDQNSTSWVAQAEEMDRHSPALATFVKIASLGLVAPNDVIAAEQVQAINPLLIMLLIPLFNFVIYPLMSRVFEPTPLRKVGIGFLLTIASFLFVYAIDLRLEAGERVHVSWQLLAFVILTAGEVMVSITVLEYSYTQAPPALKSIVMSLNMLSVSLGNVMAAGVNWLIGSSSLGAHLKGPNYFLFFSVLMGTSTLLYIFASRHFHEKTYIQPSKPEAAGA
ncbi:MAG: MFS transporter [Pirellulales bacterium]